jgi:hypothetical protein
MNGPMLFFDVPGIRVYRRRDRMERDLRRRIRPPSGCDDHLSRREAAQVLGFASEFKVRQLEKEGRLRPIRGAMGSAWYPRAAVVALVAAGRRARERAKQLAPASDGARGEGRPSDAALIAYLRERPRTVVDLVADTGISISRAERVYRFWAAHDAAPPSSSTAESAERRSGDRLEREALLRRLKDADPRVRAAAFDGLKRLRAAAP